MKKFDLSQILRCYQVTVKGPDKQTVLNSILDTGADVSIVDSSLLYTLGIDKHRCVLPRMAVKMADGRVIDGCRVKMKVIAEGKEITIAPMVLDNAPMPLILGLDFLKEIDYAPLYIRQFSTLYHYIQRFRKGCVLIIGKDSDDESIDKLRLIQKVLKEHDYEGILLKDFPDIPEQAIEEKMNLFGSISRFVICENSSYSGHMDELSICARNRFVTVVMQQEGKYTTWLQECYPIDFKFIKKVQYKSGSMQVSIVQAIKSAEKTVRERRCELDNLYSYRKKIAKKDKS